MSCQHLLQHEGETHEPRKRQLPSRSGPKRRRRRIPASLAEARQTTSASHTDRKRRTRAGNVVCGKDVGDEPDVVRGWEASCTSGTSGTRSKEETGEKDGVDTVCAVSPVFYRVSTHARLTHGPGRDVRECGAAFCARVSSGRRAEHVRFAFNSCYACTQRRRAAASGSSNVNPALSPPPFLRHPKAPGVRRRSRRTAAIRRPQRLRPRRRFGHGARYRRRPDEENRLPRAQLSQNTEHGVRETREHAYRDARASGASRRLLTAVCSRLSCPRCGSRSAIAQKQKQPTSSVFPAAVLAELDTAASSSGVDRRAASPGDACSAVQIVGGAGRSGTHRAHREYDRTAGPSAK